MIKTAALLGGKKRIRHKLKYLRNQLLVHEMHYAIDSIKLQHELAWKPNLQSEEGIAKSVCWYPDNQA